MFRSMLPRKGSWMLVLLMLACGGMLPASTYYFPHVANGMTGDSTYFTRFLISNGNVADNQVTLNFYLESGSGWNIPVTSPDRQDIAGTANQFQFDLDAFETVVINTVGAGSAHGGMGLLTEPVLGRGIVRIYPVSSRSHDPDRCGHSALPGRYWIRHERGGRRTGMGHGREYQHRNRLLQSQLCNRRDHANPAGSWRTIHPDHRPGSRKPHVPIPIGAVSHNPLRRFGSCPAADHQ